MSKIAEKYARANYPDEPSCGQFGTGDYEPYVDCSYLREIASEAYDQSAKDIIARIREIANTIDRRITKDGIFYLLDRIEKEYE